MMTQGKDEFFVKLNEPVSIRRAVLECTKDAVLCLQRYERFKTLRQQRLAAMNQLSSLASEIEEISEELERHMPEASYDSAKKFDKVPTVGEEVLEEDLKSPVEKDRDELAELEKSIYEMEKKIGDI